MVWIGVVFLLVAAWMTYGFHEEYQKAGGMPWAAEVPLALITTMAAFGLFFVIAGFMDPF